MKLFPPIRSLSTLVDEVRDPQTEKQMLNVGREVTLLVRMSAKQLRQRYYEVFGEENNSRNKAWLVKRITWRLRCVPCASAMIPTHAVKNSTKRYRYYVCCSAQKRGWHTCPSKSVPAGEIEALVLKQIRTIGHDSRLLAEVLNQVRHQDETQVTGLAGEQRRIERELRAWHAEMQTLSGNIKPGDDNSATISRLADLQDRIAAGEDRVRSLVQEIDSVERQIIEEHEAANILAVFDPAWQALTPREQMRIVQLLVEQVDYDGARGKVSISFRPTGIKMLANELTPSHRGAKP